MGIDTAHYVGNASAGPAATVRRARDFSLPGALRRLLGRADPKEAAAYEQAAREAFRVGTPTDVPTSASPVDAGDSAGSRDARPPGPLAEPARLQDATNVKRPIPLGSEPAKKPHGSADAYAKEAAIEERLPDLNSRDTVDAATDLLRTPNSVTPVVDDFFDGLIRRVEGKR